MIPPPPGSTLFPYTTLFRSPRAARATATWWLPSWCAIPGSPRRSEEYTSELQSHSDLVCRLLLEKKKDDRALFPAQPGGRCPQVRARRRPAVTRAEDLLSRA